jgi:hypothetical protein
MKKRNLYITGSALVAVALAAAFFAGRALAGGIPATGALTYSGLLQDVSGAPLTGSHAIQVNFWSAATGGTTPLCQTASASITLDAGRFSVALPDTCTDVVKANKDAWVDVLVDGVSLGRTKLGAVPYAVEAAHATSADTATSATSATTATNATTAATANAAGGALKTTIDGLAAKADLPKITAWTAYTPALDAQGAAVTGVPTNVGFWRRLGDSIEVMITTRFNTASSDTRFLIWHLPSNFQPSRPSGEPYALGSAVTRAGAVFGACVVDTESNSGDGVFALCDGTDALRRSDVGTGGKVLVMLHFTVPISGWTLTTP